ncbi:MAG: hypothetical protein EYC62_06605, partial [Alphaproteobacteria bacterium]
MVQIPKMYVAEMRYGPAPRSLGLKGAGVLTMRANSGFYNLGHAQRTAILREVSVDPRTGNKSAAASIPLIVNATFLVNGDDNKKWAEAQAGSFNPDNAQAWDYARFRETLGAKGILPHSIDGEPSESSALICGETTYRYHLMGRPPSSGIACQVGLWTAPDQVIVIRQAEIKDGQEAITDTVPADQLPGLWDQAAAHMQANIFPKIKTKEQEPPRKRPSAPASSLLQSKIRSDGALTPKPMTTEEYIRQWQLGYK